VLSGKTIAMWSSEIMQKGVLAELHQVSQLMQHCSVTTMIPSAAFLPSSRLVWGTSSTKSSVDTSHLVANSPLLDTWIFWPRKIKQNAFQFFILLIWCLPSIQVRTTPCWSDEWLQKWMNSSLLRLQYRLANSSNHKARMMATEKIVISVRDVFW